MNNAMIRYILGIILKLEAAFLLLPCLFAVIYQEKEGLVYAVLAAAGLLLGFLFSRNKPKNTQNTLM